jgi:long-chain fatty acid transport protein
MKTPKTLVVLALLVPAAALGSGFEVINVNPRDLALSSSAVAAQHDAAATFGNSSALSKLEGFNLSVAGSVLALTTKWTAPTGGTSGLTGSATTKFAPTPPVAIYAAWGTRLAGRGFGVGAGIGTPGGGQMRWDEAWQGRGRIITVERRIIGAYLTAGYEVTPWLRLGGGGVYYYGIQYLKQGIEPFLDAYGELSTTGGGFSYNLSAEATLMEGLTLGVDYKHQAFISMSGDGHFQVPPSLAGPGTQDQGVKQDLPFPNTLAVGVAWRVSRPVQLTLQYNFSRFEIYTEDVFRGDAGLVLTVPRNYDNGHIIRGGVEWYTSERLTLRAGLMRDFSGLRSDTLSPTLPDSNTTGASIGASWAFRPGLAVHGAFFYGDRDKQTATGTVAFPGSYKTEIVLFSAGVTWAPGAGGH